MSIELDRAKIVDAAFTECVKQQVFPQPKSATTPAEAGLAREAYLSLFDSMLHTRHIDFVARILKEKNIGFYTIGSSGHESNAAIAASFRYNDIAFLHYRSSAFMLERAKQVPGVDGVRDQLLSLVAAQSDPISSGRHKVFGRLNLFVPPQTSTIASHLPKVFGSAFALSLSKRLKSARPYLKLPQDSVVIGSFGDASFNHSTFQGALNAVNWVMHRHVPLPLVLVCEDNGIGISVPTPEDWIALMMQSRPDWHYLYADGLNLADVFQKARAAEQLARKGHPVFLHVKMLRLLGHAGSDIEQHYRSIDDILAIEAEDPLLHAARTIIQNQWLTFQDILKRYETLRDEVAKKAEAASLEPGLKDAKTIMASIVPPLNKNAMPAFPQVEARKVIFGKQFEQLSQPRNMANLINFALTDIMLQYPQCVVFGEDVGKKGGVYRVTADLQARFGVGRVFDTLLDEQTILGTAIGMAHHGLLPIPEIQFLAYTHNAVDQLRGEAATLSFFSSGQFTNPMVVRIPSFGYQKGFGGHFHNDNAIAFLREIPGIILACPSNPVDAALMLRQCVAQAYHAQRVVIFLEPIALYHQKELNGLYPEPKATIPFGEIGIQGKGTQLAIVSFGNGHFLSSQVANVLREQHRIELRLIDLRWLHPLNESAIINAVKDCSTILIVDEGRKTGSLSEALVTLFYEQGITGKIARVTGEDTFIPLGKAWQYVLPSVDSILTKALSMQTSHTAHS